MIALAAIVAIGAVLFFLVTSFVGSVLGWLLGLLLPKLR